MAANIINKKLQDRLDKVDEIRADLNKAEKSATKEIMSILKSLMKSNPLLKGVRWTQYTPHFNDGDACEFGIHGPEFKFADSFLKDDEEEEFNDEGWFDEYTVDDEFFKKRKDILNHEEINSLEETVANVDKVFEKLTSMETHLQNVFGDGFRITVTSTGVESEEFEHD